MNRGRTMFSPRMDLLPLPAFRRCVGRYQGDYQVQSFSCLAPFLSWAFAPLPYRQSLRDIETCWRAQRSPLYPRGLRGGLSRPTLANANQQRDWRIDADFARLLLAPAGALYRHEPFGVEWDQTVYAFDSTPVDWCWSLFPWAQFRRRQSAVKLHPWLDRRGNIPTAVSGTGGQGNDGNRLDPPALEAGAFYLLDRGSVDYRRLSGITPALAFFLPRAERNTRYRRCAWRWVDPSTGLRSDPTIRLTGPQSSRRYPAPLRRIHSFDAEKDWRLLFLPNNFPLQPLTIAQLYRARWQVEWFFRWIQHPLPIRAFYGASPNAVQTQVWVAITVSVLVAILKKPLQRDLSWYKILQIRSVTIFETTPISSAFSQYNDRSLDPDPPIQMDRFHL